MSDVRAAVAAVRGRAQCALCGMNQRSKDARLKRECRTSPSTSPSPGTGTGASPPVPVPVPVRVRLRFGGASPVVWWHDACWSFANRTCASARRPDDKIRIGCIDDFRIRR